MDDREIGQWEKRLADQVMRGWDNYKHLHIDLTTVRLDEPIRISGEYLYVEESSSGLAVAKIKLNRNTNDALDLEKGVKIETVFIEVYITNDALEDEWIDLVFGINFNYQKILSDLDELKGDLLPEAYSTATIGMVAAVVYAANANRKGFDLQAGLGNTGNVYIGFDNTVTAANCAAALVAGQSYSRDDYRGPLYAIASAAGQLLNRSEV